jgi:hypothetical protein
MEYKLVFPRDQSIDQTNYYIINDAFNAKELEWINNLHELYPFQEATVMGENDGIRKSEVKWMHSDDKSFWVYEKIGQYIQQANNELWKFDLHSIIDSTSQHWFQLLRHAERRYQKLQVCRGKDCRAYI